MKELVGALNQEKALVAAFSVIVKSSRTFVLSSMLHQPRQMQYQTKPIRCHQLSSQARARAFYRHQDIFILRYLQFEFQVQCDLISFKDRHNLDMNVDQKSRVIKRLLFPNIAVLAVIVITIE